MTADDTTDLRSGPPIADRLLALLPLVGRWRGTGTGVVPASDETFTFAQEVSFAHDGRPFLVYESLSWLVDDTGTVVRATWRESGFWRPGAAEDDVEVVLAANTGQALMFGGTAGDLRWELATTSAVPTPTATVIDGERRLYAVLADELVYATELGVGGQPYRPHLNARLARA
jgi:hypothetical protein